MRVTPLLMLLAAFGIGVSIPSAQADDDLAEARQELAEEQAEAIEEGAEELAEEREEFREERAEAIEEAAEDRNNRFEATEDTLGSGTRERMRERAEDRSRFGTDTDTDTDIEVDGEQQVKDSGRTTAEGRRSARKPAGPAARQVSFDQQLAESLAWGNQAEIAVSEMATERATTDAVRQFAEKMVQVHTERLQALDEFIESEIIDIRTHQPNTQTNSQTSTRDGDRGADRNRQQRSERNGVGSAALSDDQQSSQQDFREQRRKAYSGSNDLEGAEQQDRAATGLREEFRQTGDDRDGQQARGEQSRDSRNARNRSMANRNRNNARQSMEDVWADASAICLTQTLEELQAQQGLDFDWGYTSQQWLAHVKCLSELKAMQGRGSDRFNQMVSDGIKTVEGHLGELKQIMAQLERVENKRENNSNSATR